VTAPIVGSMAENAIVFGVYGTTRRLLSEYRTNNMAINPQQQSNDKNNSLVDSVIAGCASGLFVSFWLTPVELIKCRLQVRSSQSHITFGWLVGYHFMCVCCFNLLSSY